jgi:hypothetical protein
MMFSWPKGASTRGIDQGPFEPVGLSQLRGGRHEPIRVTWRPDFSDPETRRSLLDTQSLGM